MNGPDLVHSQYMHVQFRVFKKKKKNLLMEMVPCIIFISGATISKGINRAVGTMVGGGLGCVIALGAKKHDEIARALTICPTVLLFSKDHACHLHYNLIS